MFWRGALRAYWSVCVLLVLFIIIRRYSPHRPSVYPAAHGNDPKQPRTSVLTTTCERRTAPRMVGARTLKHTRAYLETSSFARRCSRAKRSTKQLAVIPSKFNTRYHYKHSSMKPWQLTMLHREEFELGSSHNPGNLVQTGPHDYTSEEACDGWLSF